MHYSQEFYDPMIVPSPLRLAEDITIEPELDAELVIPHSLTITWQAPLLLTHVNRLKNNPGVYIIEKKYDYKGRERWRPIYVGEATGLRTRLMDHRLNLQQKDISRRSRRVRVGTIRDGAKQRLKFAQRVLIRTLAYKSRRYKYKDLPARIASRRTRPSHLTNDQDYTPFRFDKRTKLTFKGVIPPYLTTTLDKVLRATHRSKIMSQTGNTYTFNKGTQYESEDGDVVTNADADRFMQRLRQNKFIRKLLLSTALRLAPAPLPDDAIPPHSAHQTRPERKRGSRIGGKEKYFEADAELTPDQKQRIDSQLEDLGYAAAAAQTETEAEALVGAMVPLATQLIYRVKPLMLTSAPAMVAGLGATTKLLHRNPKTRPLLRTMPTILHHTAAVLNREMLNGRKPTPKGAVKVLADQAAKVIGSPRQTQRALQHAHDLRHQH